MVTRPLVVMFAVLAIGTSVRAADLPTLPTLAVDPQVSEPWWHGLTVGSEVSIAAAKGVKGMAGGAGFVGYSHAFDNNLVIGVQAAAGYAPYAIQNGAFKGADFIGMSAQVGYEMGRLTPFLTTSFDLAHATQFSHGYTGGIDAINAFLNGGGDTAALGTIGAGFDYAVTNNLHVGIAVNAGNYRGGVWP
jgi:hypothetical protein